MSLTLPVSFAIFFTYPHLNSFENAFYVVEYNSHDMR